MEKKILPLLIFNFQFLIFNCFSQPAIQWEKSFGGSGNDYCRFAIETTDGGNIVAGYSNSTNGDVTGNHGGYDMWVLKTDSLGIIQWENSYGGTASEIAYNIAPANDGGFILSGFTTSKFTGTHGGTDVILVKISSSGNLQWQKFYGGSGNDGNIESGIFCTSDGGYIVTTNTFSNDQQVSGNHGGDDWWIFKTDSDGNLQWQKCYGGSSNEDSHTIFSTSDDGYIIAGHTSSNDGDVGPTKGGDDEWILKINSAGTIQWSKTFGGSGDDVAFYLSQANDGGYAVGGYSNSTNGDVTGNHGLSDYWLLKINSSGNLLWEKSFGGSQDDFALRVISDTDGGFVLGGYSNSTDGDVTNVHGDFDYWLLKTNSSGNLQWEKSFGGTGTDNLTGLSLSPEGYFISGFSNSNDGDVSGNHGGTDVWSARLHISSPTGISENENKNYFSVYPTFFSDGINIESSIDEEITISVFNLLSEKVYEEKKFSRQSYISLNNLSNGIYILKISSSQKFFTKKIIKQ